MPNRKIQDSIKMREWAKRAIEEGAETPKDLLDYFIDNGWSGKLPERQTFVKLLEENGIEYVQGYWTKTK